MLLAVNVAKVWKCDRGRSVLAGHIQELVQVLDAYDKRSPKTDSVTESHVDDNGEG